MENAPNNLKPPFLAIDKNNECWCIVEGPYRLTTWRGYKYPSGQMKYWSWLASMDLKFLNQIDNY